MSALLLASVTTLFFVRSSVRTTLVQEISTDAAMTAHQCNYALMFDDAEDVQRTLQALKTKEFIVFGGVYDTTGQLFATYRRLDYRGSPPAINQRDHNGQLIAGMLTVFTDIIVNDEILGTLCIQADLEPLHAASRRAVMITLLVICVALLLGSGLAAVLSSVVSKPILSFANMAKNISDTGDYSERALVMADDEIGFLAKMFNRMLDQIQQRDMALVNANANLNQEVDERKKAEETLAAINQELQEFAYVVSHDLKAPLRGIDTLINWIEKDSKDELNEESKENFVILKSRTKRMRDLIDGILKYSRVGRASDERAQIDLGKLIPEIIDLIDPSDGIEITIENELPIVEFEETRLFQVFQNLLSNAVKYMDKPKGDICIGCLEEDGFWKFSVSDNGPGIEEQYFERIFKMFQTLTPRDSYESTGVGLALVKKIVEMCGGKIGVESEVGKGSTFWFTINSAICEDVNERLTADLISGR